MHQHPELHGWLASHESMKVCPLPDPVVEALGYEPRSTYVETYWLPVLGPSALWVLRRLAAWLEAEPTGVEVNLAGLAQGIGLGAGVQRNSPLVRTLGRLVLFGMAEVRGDELAVRTVLPPLARRHIMRLPAELVASHEVELRRGARQTIESREDGMAPVIPFPA